MCTKRATVLNQSSGGGTVSPRGPYWSTFYFQSEDVNADGVGTNELVTPTETTTENVSFLEDSGGYQAGAAAILSSGALFDATPNVSLNEFLSRPVRINSFTWNESDGFGALATINPWLLFYQNVPIQNKLANYAWLRCDLHIKVMVNASPFYYGAMMMSYQPLPSFKPSTIINDAGTRYFIPYSQRPHIWIYPQNNEGGELMLPFFWPKNWISTNISQDFTDMGQLTFLNIGPLQSANGVIGSGVTVTTYAWAENVTVSGPTVGLLLQAKDEYGNGIVATTATAIAAAAKALTAIPLIRPFATATQMGASAIAQIASFLGFSNTPVIDDAMPYRPMPFPVFASTEQGYPIEKLTIDPKNELSVDPTVVGLHPVDELSIKYLVQKESYLCFTNWFTTTPLDSLLFQSAITPTMFDVDASVSTKIYMVPSCWISQMFLYWRGDYIFRFRFIASQFHRGRVRIIYDPSGNATQNVCNTADTQPVCFNEIIDLTKDTNVEVRVPYNQALAWCRTSVASTVSLPWSTGPAVNFQHTPNLTNGTLVMRVVTALTAPVILSNVPIIISVRAADNLEFGGPIDVNQNFSQFAVQSLDEYEMTQSNLIIAGSAPCDEVPEKYLINFGEKIFSLRQVLRRYSLASANYFLPAAGAFGLYSEVFDRMPLAFGYDPNGQYQAKGLIATATNFNFNFVPVHPLQWVAMCFIGYRGSVNWSVNTDSSVALRVIKISRSSGQVNVGFGQVSVAAGTNSANQNTIFRTMGQGQGNASGLALTNTFTNAGMNVAAPMYSAFKFMSLDKSEPSSNSETQDDDLFGRMRLDFAYDGATLAPAGVKYYKYAGIGTDWGCHFFLNVPTITHYVSNPIPN